ncbi:putative uncharacterized protein DDB_G0288959 [Oppia nitens]|uniref:putative uncharacterized protein DDB_G0288959 n=1 Tax=Oppia nitens TaxID=1686743 RepID=UPI0023DB2B17|nr:putative uncharacterized protein DDB_G0288959 [Oppia nitens]
MANDDDNNGGNNEGNGGNNDNTNNNGDDENATNCMPFDAPCNKQTAHLCCNGVCEFDGSTTHGECGRVVTNELIANRRKQAGGNDDEDNDDETCLPGGARCLKKQPNKCCSSSCITFNEMFTHGKCSHQIG